MNFQIKKYRRPTIPIPRKRGKNNIKCDKYYLIVMLEYLWILWFQSKKKYRNLFHNLVIVNKSKMIQGHLCVYVYVCVCVCVCVCVYIYIYLTDRYIDKSLKTLFHQVHIRDYDHWNRNFPLGNQSITAYTNLKLLVFSHFKQYTPEIWTDNPFSACSSKKICSVS